MDGKIMTECFGLPANFDCEECPNNLGLRDGFGGGVGPCGQQNCWYSCTVCMYNHMDDCGEES